MDIDSHEEHGPGASGPRERVELDAATANITQFLSQMSAGDDQARRRVWELLQEEIRRCATRAAQGTDRRGLQATELIGIAFLRIGSLEGKAWKDRKHFISVAALAMRSAVIDHARSRDHRGGPSSLDSIVTQIEGRVDGDLLGFYDELNAFSELDPVMAHAAELKALGYSSVETAALVGLSQRTFNRQFVRARAYLRYRLQWKLNAGDE